MAGSRGIVLSGLTTLHRTILGTNTVGNSIAGGVLSQVRNYAARRGTREKANKKKVKKEVKKLTIAEKIAQSKKNVVVKPRALIYMDHFLPEGTNDDVYFMKYYKKQKYSFEEAIQNHREYLHPTILNSPSSFVELFAELNFEGKKKTKPVETFQKMVPITHKFDSGEERKILAFCKTEDQVAEAIAEGACLAGGTDIVKLIVNGEISVHNYDVCVAHPSILPEILTIRGLLKRKQPNIKAGTISPDLKSMIYTQLHGISYTAKAYTQYPTYGEATIRIGKLDMDVKFLEENMIKVIESLMSAKPKRPGSFINSLEILCSPSLQRFKIDHTLYIQEEETPENKATAADEDDNDDEEDQGAVAVTV